jgi:hypothetical protein
VKTKLDFGREGVKELGIYFKKYKNKRSVSIKREDSAARPAIYFRNSRINEKVLKKRHIHRDEPYVAHQSGSEGVTPE